MDITEIIQEVVVSPPKRAAYYRFTHLMILLLEKHQIRYFAHSGTMLGAVRHKGFIPWDDDVDVMIPDEDSPKLQALMDEIDAYGVKLGSSKTVESGLVQFVPTSKKVLTGYPYFMGFDVFIGEPVEVDGAMVYHYKSPDFRRWFKRRYVAIEHVFPRKRYTFGPLSIWGMRAPEEYFARSGFKLDEAIIGVHKGAKEKADRVIAQLTEAGLYPIRDPQVLAMQSPFGELDLYELDHYRLDPA